MAHVWKLSRVPRANVRYARIIATENWQLYTFSARAPDSNYSTAVLYCLFLLFDGCKFAWNALHTTLAHPKDTFIELWALARRHPKPQQKNPQNHITTDAIENVRNVLSPIFVWSPLPRQSHSKSDASPGLRGMSLNMCHTEYNCHTSPPNQATRKKSRFFLYFRRNHNAFCSESPTTKKHSQRMNDLCLC